MKLFLSALAVCLAGAASATTVTFDHVNITPNPANNDWIGLNQGFLYDFNFAYLAGDHISLHDDSGLTSSAIRRQDGAKFTPTSVDLLGLSRIYKTGSGPNTDNSWYTAGTVPPLTLSFFGVLGNQVVATQSVSTFNRLSTDWATTAFSSAFTGIDQLVLSLQLPTNPIKFDGFPPGIGSDQVWCFEWCGEYRVDNLVVSQVAPVPLPASGLLLLGAMLGMLGYRRVTRV